MPSMASKCDKAPSVELTTPVQFLKGCGSDRAEKLARLGVTSAGDLVFMFPRAYQDLSDVRTVDQLEEGKLVSVIGVVDEIELRDRGGGRSVLGVLLREGSLYLRLVWFDQPFMRERFKPGQRILVSGKAKYFGNRWQMSHPQVKPLEEDEAPQSGQLLPVYPLTEGLQQRHVRTLVKAALDGCLDTIEEVFPAAYLAKLDLLPIGTALAQLHFPDDRASLERATRRFVYQELLVMQLALALRRTQSAEAAEAPPLPISAKIDARIRRLFPFELTAGQNQVIAEIIADLGRTQAMNRLLEGEVGSGKTVVAVYAMLLAVAHGAQAALMAPTELLARQHARTLEKLLAASHVKMAVLTGSTAEKERREILAGVAAGDVQLLLGTQALIESEVKFARLGLVVIDEQHKFGVRERAAFRQAGQQPHCLLMTATPIPRTVALSVYGDLDLSTLRERPAGRQKVHTYLPAEADWPRWWEFFRKKLREGRQGYVVAPLVEGDDASWPSLEQSFEALANGELEAFRLGLVHGRLTGERKDAAMQAFRRGETQVLVATSVVEVGVDVPNATLMTIQGAQRFGLAQLHQLRGRISRGAYPGYCCLLASATGEAARQRLEAIVQSDDGFELAEIDFQLRGPGELIGDRQHGLPALRIADLARDREILEMARRDAQALLAQDPGLDLPEHALLRRRVLARYGRTLELGDVG
jgi:ATP-dependent DNA helicase RecG